jgi:Homeodomain-like domain
VLEACCRSPVTLQRDLKRARIVLLASVGRSTRSIAKEVGVQPRIVSLWRHRYADHGLEGLKDKPRPGKQPTIRRPPTSGFCRVVALTPGLASREVNLVAAQEPPDILDVNIAQRLGQQGAGPACKPFWWRFVQQPRSRETRRGSAVLNASQ